MAFLRQILLIALVAFVALWGWVRYVPSSTPYLEEAGVAAWLRDNQFSVLGVPVLPAPAPVVEKAGPPEAGGGPRGPGARGPSRVLTAPAGEGALNDRVTAIGDGHALRAVTVMPEDSGRIVEIPARPGQFVEAGAVLAQLDSEAEEIALERARLLREDAADRVERQQRLYESGAASDVQLRDAQLALRTAELEVRQREFDLRRRTILAPIRGWIGLIAVDVGDQVTTSTPITQLDDRIRILVEFRLPERFVGRLKVGDAVRAEPVAQPGKVYLGLVSEIDNQVDQTSRSLRVRAELDNTSDDLRSGMSFVISLDFPGEPRTAVSALAVQWSGGGSFIWVVENGAAVRVPVRIVQRTADQVLIEGKIEPGAQVITEGVQMLRPGAAVAVAGAAQGEGASGPGMAGAGASAGGGAPAVNEGTAPADPGVQPVVPAADPAGAGQKAVHAPSREETVLRPGGTGGGAAPRPTRGGSPT